VLCPVGIVPLAFSPKSNPLRNWKEIRDLPFFFVVPEYIATRERQYAKCCAG